MNNLQPVVDIDNRASTSTTIPEELTQLGNSLCLRESSRNLALAFEFALTDKRSAHAETFVMEKSADGTWITIHDPNTKFANTMTLETFAQFLLSFTLSE